MARNLDILRSTSSIASEFAVWLLSRTPPRRAVGIGGVSWGQLDNRVKGLEESHSVFVGERLKIGDKVNEIQKNQAVIGEQIKNLDRKLDDIAESIKNIVKERMR